MDDDERHAIALWRLGVLGPLMSARLEHGDVAAHIRAAAERRHRMPSGREVSLSASTIEDWHYAYQRGGLAALKPKDRSDKGTTRAIRVEVADLLLRAKAERPRRSIRRLIKMMVRAGAARGVCVDVDPQRIAESRENAERAGVADRVRFLNQDLFATDLGEATVVMLFLSPEFNLKLKPRLQRELKAGARIVSHWHSMGDWEPQQTLRLTSAGRERNIFLWTIAPR